MNNIAYRLKIFGNVQGVGYRNWLRKRALEAGITGWVRNRADYTVEALIEGKKDAINKVIEDCANGPKFAKVTWIEKRRVEPEGFREFTIKR